MLSTNYPLMTFHICHLRTLSLSDTSILLSGVYTCLCYRTSDAYGSVLLYSYGLNKMYILRRVNTTYQINEFTGTLKTSWTV